jgi:hypothetical protein
MAAQAWFSSGDVDVAPGTTAVLQLTVVNLSDTTDTFVLNPVGMPAGWSTLRPANLTLFGGTQQIVDVEVSPPMLPSTTSGPTALSVRIVPQHDPDNLTTAETTLIIGESFDRRLNVLQPALRGRRTATYDMMLENRGNTQASCRLHLVDPSGRIEGEFDPPAAGVEPGASTLVRLKVHTTGMQWERHPRTVPFRIDADQPGSPTATSPATFVQTPVIPENLIGRLIAAGAALGVLALAWFALVKPAIDDAAQAAVDKAVPTQSTTLDSSPDIGSESTVVSTPVDDKGAIVNIPLPVSVPQGQSGANQYTVPAGKILRVTDIIVQNPQVDQGTLVLSKDGNALFSYSFAPMFGVDVDQPLVTPLELAANQQLTVTVTCDGVSDLTATACNANVFVSGRLVDA